LWADGATAHVLLGGRREFLNFVKFAFWGEFSSYHYPIKIIGVKIDGICMYSFGSRPPKNRKKMANGS
jgi:hypothetical protein